MAVNLINSSDIEVTQTGNNIELNTTVDMQTLESNVGDLDDLNTTDKSSLVNAINELCVEKGTENGWTWEKYSNGKAICYGTFSKNITVTTSWGSLYNGIFGSINFPENLFIEIPTTFKNVATGFSCWLMASGLSVSKTSTEQIACVRPTNVTTASAISIDYLAIGKWK